MSELRRVPLRPGDAGTDQTIAEMVQVARAAAVSAEVRSWALRLLELANARREAFPYYVERFLRGAVSFVPDPPGEEYVRQPAKMIREIQSSGHTTGDCDDLATLAAAVLMAVGYRIGFVVIGTETAGGFAHVHYAVFESGRYVPFDPQERTTPGVWTAAARRRIYGPFAA